MQVKAKSRQLAGFHGHLCPELAIGYRACLLAQRELMLEEMWQSQFDVIVENTTSAPGIAQMLIGCTFNKDRPETGNGNEHRYTFTLKGKYTLEVKLKNDALPLPDDFEALKQKVNTGEASPWETSLYWAIIDRLVDRLLQLPDKELFHIRKLSTKEA